MPTFDLTCETDALLDNNNNNNNHEDITILGFKNFDFTNNHIHATATTVDGKEVHCYAEHNPQFWKQYLVDDFSYLGSRGIFSFFSTLYIQDSEEATQNALSDLYDKCEMINSTEGGFTKEEFLKFAADNKERFLKNKTAMRNAGVGKSEIHVINLVCYLTKEPVDFEERTHNLNEAKEAPNVKDYLNKYSNYLMVVGSNNASYNFAAENRGIFKMIGAYIEDGYKNLSIILHSFIGAMMNSLAPEKPFIIVKPVESMFNILLNNIEAGEMFIGTSRGEDEDFLEKDKESYKGKKSFEEKKFPPLVHYYGKGVNLVAHIAKPGTDIKEYTDMPLPAEKALVKCNIPPASGCTQPLTLIDIKYLTKVFKEKHNGKLD